MRGQGINAGSLCRVEGITPADAGTSRNALIYHSIKTDHPRGCGDKPDWRHNIFQDNGSPPRMRGQGNFPLKSVREFGITPADAGTRAPSLWRPHGAEDHPRGCGDKAYNDGWIGSKWGSPPRMRGQVPFPKYSSHSPGITPADAGTSARICSSIRSPTDHPRGCGDKFFRG